MHRESNPTMDVHFAHELGQQHEVGVMDPHHFFAALLHCADRLDVCLVELDVGAPHGVLLLLSVLDIQALEVMEERPKDLLMEHEILHDDLFLGEDGNAVMLSKNLSDFLLLGLFFDENAWPADPDRFHLRVPLAHFKQVIVQDALRSFHDELSCLLVLLDDLWQFERDNYNLVF